jgi:hypothetical protein
MEKIQIPTTDGHKETNVRMEHIRGCRPHIAIYSDCELQQSTMFRFSFDNFLDATEQYYGMNAALIDHLLKLQIAIGKRIIAANKSLA